MLSPASAIFADIVTILVSFEVILKRFFKNQLFKVNFKVMIYHKFWNTSKLLKNLQVLWHYSRLVHLQVNTFFKYWVNTCEYYHHNTYEYWAGEYTPTFQFVSRFGINALSLHQNINQISIYVLHSRFRWWFWSLW